MKLIAVAIFRKPISVQLSFSVSFHFLSLLFLSAICVDEQNKYYRLHFVISYPFRRFHFKLVDSYCIDEVCVCNSYCKYESHSHSESMGAMHIVHM